MFNSKKTQLFERPVDKVSSNTSTVTQDNPFVQAGLKKSAETVSGNGALKYSTTGNAFVDQFGVLGSYKKPRNFSEIAADCEKLWAENKLLAVVFILYIRMITRVVVLFTGVSTKAAQKGAELRHEGIMRMIWLHWKAPETFWKNIGLFVSVGSWKDVITMLQYDLVYNGWEGRVLDWNKFGSLILSGLNNSNTVNLLKKYLPQIKSRKNCTTVESQADTMIGKWICSLLFGEGENASKYKRYRQTKTSGTAHEWQKLISQGKHNLIDFATIHGRALHLLVKSKYLKNHNLVEKYNEWITKPETKDVKFTGFVHELFSELGGTGCKGKYDSIVSLPKHIAETINKQFYTLVNKAKDENLPSTGLIVVRDTSGSMGSIASGINMSCYAIGKALALYFSEFLKGRFANSWIEFNSNAQMHNWRGSTPVEKWYNDRSNYIGSTNFQSVIDLFCQIKLNGVQETDFPKGIICISDSEFNPTQLGRTNVEEAKLRLSNAGFSKEYVDNFVIVLWNLQSSHYGKNTGKKFETFGNVSNVFYLSGYSAANVSFVTGNVRNANELFLEAMNQEILQMVEL
jgi:hypothetical protein